MADKNDERKEGKNGGKKRFSVSRWRRDFVEAVVLFPLTILWCKGAVVTTVVSICHHHAVIVVQ